MTQTNLLTMNEVAKRLRTTRNTIYRLLKTDPEFRTLKVGMRRFMREEQLETYIRARESAEA